MLLALVVFVLCWCDCIWVLCRFLKGLPIAGVTLSEELREAIGMEPLVKGISYIISTKVHTHFLIPYVTI